MSGSIDFYWQFRVVDSQKVEDIVVDGYVEDIDSDFGFIYFIKIEITDASDLIKQLKDKKSALYKEFKAEFNILKEEKNLKVDMNYLEKQKY